MLQIFLVPFLSFLLFVNGSFEQNGQRIELNQTRSYTYLALGDSYTIGTGVHEVSSYPKLLEKSLKNKGWECAKSTILAKSGWTSGILWKQLEKENIPDSSYSFVTLQIGVNDQFRHIFLQEYELYFKNLVKQAIRIAGSEAGVIVVSIPDYSATPSFNEQSASKIKKELDKYNAINQRISTEYGVHFVDITAISSKSQKDRTYLSADLLHPSLRMYQEWVDMMLPVANEILEK